MAALITGAADGIGAGIAVELARRGLSLTLVDINYEGSQRVAEQCVAAGGRAQAVACDVADEKQQEKTFLQHMSTYGRLDMSILNAGIMESGDLVSVAPNARSTDGWRKTLDVNLVAVMLGIRLAVRAMASSGCKGTIMITASAGGIYPMSIAPVYSATKAASIMLARSLGEPLMRRHGIRICTLCPQFTDTAMVRGIEQRGEAVAAELTREIGGMGRLLRREQVVSAGIKLLTDPSKVGTTLVVLAPSGDLVEPQRTKFKSIEFRTSARAGGPSEELRAWASGSIPRAARKIVVRALSTDFRAATAIVDAQVPNPPPAGHVLVRNCSVGINASDINFTSGKYQGSRAQAEKALPFGAGFETVGLVAAVGPGLDPALASELAPGTAVAAMSYGGFSEYQAVQAKQCFVVPLPSPQVLALLTSGLTASIALEQAGRMSSGEKVLVTAAAGGTGQFAVQLAKAAGNHVIATCGGEVKAATLRALGVDRVINYKEEDVKGVLRAEYKGGVDIVYESVGGQMFKTCVGALAPRGRLIIIGAVSQYAEGWAPSVHEGLQEFLLARSATLSGFFLPLYARHYKRHFRRLMEALESGALRVVLDTQRFVGLEAVAPAVDRLQSGDSVGKVYVQVAGSVPAGAEAGPAARL